VPLSNLKVKDNQTQCLSLILSVAKGHKLIGIPFILAFIEKWMILFYLLPILGHSVDTCWEKLLNVPFFWISFQVNLTTY